VTTHPTWQRLLLEETGSTQDHGRQLALAEPGIHRAIRAVRQTAGRGRRGNQWSSPEGGLWCTLTIPTHHHPEPFHNLLVALAARQAVCQLLGKSSTGVALKWPNDLVVDGRKWGGVVAEVCGPPSAPDVLFGIGLNLQIEALQLQKDPHVPREATSILAEFGHSPSPAEVLESILSHLDTLLLEDRQQGGRERNRLRVAEVLETLGQKIRWNGPGDECGEGEACGIAPDGALVVERHSPAPRETCQLRSAQIYQLRGEETDDPHR